MGRFFGLLQEFRQHQSPISISLDLMMSLLTILSGIWRIQGDLQVSVALEKLKCASHESRDNATPTNITSASRRNLPIYTRLFFPSLAG